jgi:hypothetical protein
LTLFEQQTLSPIEVAWPVALADFYESSPITRSQQGTKNKERRTKPGWKTPSIN